MSRRTRDRPRYRLKDGGPARLPEYIASTAILRRLWDDHPRYLTTGLVLRRVVRCFSPTGCLTLYFVPQLPSLVDDQYFEGNPAYDPNLPSPSKTATRHHIRIRRLQSEIHNRLYSAAIPEEPPANSWFDSVQSRLDQWREDWPAPTSFVSEEWLNLNYHMTVTLLLRPTAANPNPDRSQTQKALDSSSQVMRFYKDMFRKGRINYSKRRTF